MNVAQAMKSVRYTLPLISALGLTISCTSQDSSPGYPTGGTTAGTVVNGGMTAGTAAGTTAGTTPAPSRGGVCCHIPPAAAQPVPHIRRLMLPQTLAHAHVRE